MKRFTFVHAADLHLDAPVSGVGRTPLPLAEAIRDASISAWQRLVQLTVDRDAAFLLLAGDMCEGLDVGLRGQHQFRRGLETLAASGIQVIMVLGDRDNAEEWSALWPLPPGIALFGTGALESKTVDRSGQRLATVHGISQSSSNRLKNLALQFSAGQDEASDSTHDESSQADPHGTEGLRIGLLHCSLNDRPADVECSRCSVEDLARAGMQYWALGHSHRYHVVEEAGTLIVYPGTTQGRSVSLGEQGPKGAAVVEVDEDWRMSVELVPLDAVRFAMLEVAIDPIRDIAGLRDALLERLTGLRASHDRDVIARVRLLGAGPLIAELAKPRTTHDLLKQLRDDTDQERPMVWCDRIDIETSLASDEETLRRRGDFASELLQRARQSAASAAVSASLPEMDADPLDRLDLQRFELESVKPGAIVRDAARLAIGVLDQS